MVDELRYTLSLSVNEEYFLSYEQCKLDDTPVFWQGDGIHSRGYVRIEGERYRVKDTIRPIPGFVPYFKSGK